MQNRPPVFIEHVNLVLPFPKLQAMFERYREKRHRFSLPQSLLEIQADLYRLSQQGGVPASLEEQRKGRHSHRLMLYVFPRYSIGAYTSEYNDAYRIDYVRPFTLQDHDQIARGVLRISSPGWVIYEDIKHVAQHNRGRGASNRWDQVLRAWQMLDMQKHPSSKPKDAFTPAQENYLRALHSVIDITKEFEQDKVTLSRGFPYNRVEATGEEQHANRDTYVFHLHDTFSSGERDRLCVAEKSSMRGRILHVNGRKLTLKFDDEVDFNDIPQPGSLALAANDVVFKSQHRAVGMIEKGWAKNPHLLQVLVDRFYQAYTPNNTMPSGQLNEEQEKAFRKALTVPDMLLVLGPPGTGKTHTITEIVRACATREQRVLVSSKTHRAVDNVLERLPAEELTIIRVGHEDNISEQVRHLLIDVQARKLQETILRKTEQKAQSLAVFSREQDTLSLWINQLDKLIAELAVKEQTISHTSNQRQERERLMTIPVRPKLDALDNWLGHLGTWIQGRERLIGKLQRQSKALASGNQPVPVNFIASLLATCSQLCERYLQNGLERTQNRYQQTYKDREQLVETIRSILLGDPLYQQYSQTLENADGEYQRLTENTHTLISKLSNTLRGQITLQPVARQEIRSFTARTYRDHYVSIKQMLEQRNLLLTTWRAKLAEREKDLYPELLQYADVVGATCIGVATAIDSDVDFNLAIVDEAGQICLPDLLVPLVRAERAVLVGDHHQLPPYVDNEILPWLETMTPEDWKGFGLIGEETDVEWIGDLLTKSTFENLFTYGANNPHLERLIWQHRMPEVIARFASIHFYDNNLKTHPRSSAHHDPLFQSPFAFIDVPRLQKKGNERAPGDKYSSKDPEGLGGKGWYNQVEAELIADIVAAYEDEGVDWVVIVPYRAQADAIRRLLVNSIGIEKRGRQFNEQVATIDSFQGGERQKVIYGFTRSNSYGGIGFMKELRRLNVALTRAKEQLVLVGDRATLISAQDEPFRLLAQSLVDYASQYGEYISLTDCRQRLNRLRTLQQEH